MKKHNKLVSIFLFAASVSFLNAQVNSLPIADGKFKPSDESLKQYEYPAWFRDAKFGIWAHWGPQAVPRQGDWYARKMYEGPGHIDRKTKKPVEKAEGDYNYHLKNYGHPSVFGYKDIIPLWKAERWNPEELMKLYKKVGAKYFVSMGTHHDNFFLWNSKLHDWNSVKMGPNKDVVGLWQKAAQKEGLRFGISEHLAASYTWFQTAHSADKKGEKAGVPYDGNDPRYQDLYHGKADSTDTGWMTKNPVWQREWYSMIKEVVDMYQPDLLYSDSKIPFENAVGRSMIAHYYNQDIQKNKGKLEAVYNCKEASNGRFVRDVERGVLDSISEFPWQTDTSIGIIVPVKNIVLRMRWYKCWWILLVKMETCLSTWFKLPKVIWNRMFCKFWMALAVGQKTMVKEFMVHVHGRCTAKDLRPMENRKKEILAE